MDILRTPDSHFEYLHGYPFAPNYSEVKAEDGTAIRIHHLDEGPADGQKILCLHGQPSWSYLYRKMIPLLTAAGHRVIAPDLVGFGRSDKPTNMDDYTYDSHTDWLSQWLTGLDLKGLTLICQDWGGLLGLRLVAMHPERFDRVVIANTGFPDSKSVPDEVSDMMGKFWPQIPVADAAEVGKQMAAGAPGAFLYWVKFCAEAPGFEVRDVFSMMSGMNDAELEGYAAPFPDQTYMQGARKFPSCVPLLPHHKPDRQKNDAHWKVLEAFDKPVLTAFSDNDMVTKGGEVVFQKRIAGAQQVEHVTIKGAGHFLQDDGAADLSAAVIDFMAAYP